MANQRLMLVDGHAVAYRAFFAIRSLSTKDGKPTNALFGFIRMLDQLVQQWKPTHEWVVFDGGLPAERMALLETYKAQREAMPDDLRSQFSLIEEYLTLAGVPFLTVPDQEADDVMATFASHAALANAEVVLATSDKDMYQLASEQVFLVPPTKSDWRMGPEQVIEKTGVRSDQIAEWLALIGDTADNIPGVPGVGPKTAAKLLTEYGSLDVLYDRLNSVAQEKLREALRAHRDAVYRNKAMTTLNTDLSLSVSWEQGVRQKADTSGLLAFYRKMEFNSMAKALEAPSLF